MGDRMRNAVEKLVLETGEAIMRIYRDGTLDVRTKNDQTPVTAADLLAHTMLIDGLAEISSLPCISEEAEIPAFSEEPTAYWLIDPIDGTREFIHRRPTFTVNVALISSGKPIAGVVYAPDRKELYSAWDGVFRKNGQIKKPSELPTSKTVLASLSHPEPQLAPFKSNNGIEQEIRIGSSIKFCQMADGLAHYYPRFRSLSAWDVAAGDAVARAAGCRTIDLRSGDDLRYSYFQSRVDAFCVIAPGQPLPLFAADLPS